MSSKVHTSEPATADLGSVSSWGQNPLLHLKRLCARFAQLLFQEAPSGWFKWDPDEEMTQLTVRAEAPIEAKVVNSRPAIVLVRSAFAWAGIGLDQMRNFDMQDGTETKTDMVSGNVTFNCLSRVDEEAEQIAWTLSMHLWLLRKVFATVGIHDTGQRIQVLSPSPPEGIVSGSGAKEITNVPAILPVHFQITASSRPMNLQTLQNVETTLTAEYGGPYRATEYSKSIHGAGEWQTDGRPATHQVANRGILQRPHIRGRQITREDPPGSGTSPVVVRVLT